MQGRSITLRLALAILLLALASTACSKGSSSSEKTDAALEKLAASTTPVFRNLGKRGESTL